MCATNIYRNCSHLFHLFNQNTNKTSENTNLELDKANKSALIVFEVSFNFYAFQIIGCDTLFLNQGSGVPVDSRPLCLVLVGCCDNYTKKDNRNEKNHYINTKHTQRGAGTVV